MNELELLKRISKIIDGGETIETKVGSGKKIFWGNPTIDSINQAIKTIENRDRTIHSVYPMLNSVKEFTEADGETYILKETAIAREEYLLYRCKVIEEGSGDDLFEILNSKISVQEIVDLIQERDEDYEDYDCLLD